MIFPPLQHSHSEEGKCSEDSNARDGFSCHFLVSTEYYPSGLQYESQPLHRGRKGRVEETVRKGGREGREGGREGVGEGRKEEKDKLLNII